jgi:hypothetical protein
MPIRDKKNLASIIRHPINQLEMAYHFESPREKKQDQIKIVAY